MQRLATAVLLMTTLSVDPAAQEKHAFPNVDLGGRLYRAVFLSGPGALTSGDIAEVPEDLRARLSRFLVKRSAFKSAYDSKPEDADAVASDAKKRVLERAIVSLLDTDDASALAVGFVADAPIAAEWGLKPQGPLDEAAYAEKRLKPGDPIAPFLYVFIAQRQRAAFEAADRAKDVETMKAAAKKYRAVMQRARSASDPIFRLLADDLDRVPYVYVKTDKHPGTFNPDA